jgi:hypothetical protein
MLRAKVEFISFRVELRRELAKFFFRKQIEAVAARRPAPDRKGAEVAGGHKLSSKLRSLALYTSIDLTLNVTVGSLPRITRDIFRSRDHGQGLTQMTKNFDRAEVY